jgi:hypothetical protein
VGDLKRRIRPRGPLNTGPVEAEEMTTHYIVPPKTGDHAKGDWPLEKCGCAAGPWHKWPEEKPHKADEYLVYNHKGFKLTFDSYDPIDEIWAMLEDDVIAWAEVHMPE